MATETMSPLEEIAALKAKLKELKSGVGEALANEARENFQPLQTQMETAIEAIGNDENPERAAHALHWLGENIGEYRKLAKAYHVHVLGVKPVRKPRTPVSDTDAATTAKGK